MTTPKNLPEFLERFKFTVLEKGLEPALFQYFHPDEEIYSVMISAATINMPLEEFLDFIITTAMVRDTVRKINKVLDDLDDV